MIFETFAQRKRVGAREGEPEVYLYNELPRHLRHQIGMTLLEGIGSYYKFTGNEFGTNPPNANDMWEEMERICVKEIESFAFGGDTHRQNPAQKVLSYIEHQQDIDDVLSVIEIACFGLFITQDNTPHDANSRGAKQTGKESIDEINLRFEQHGIGYQFENKNIIRVDSKLSHAEIIKPALKLLMAEMFSKANHDFIEAHGHYRLGKHKDSVTASNRAFESALKAISDIEKWAYAKGDRASELVTLVTNKGLFTHGFDKSFTSYIAMLKSGLPTVRNDAGAHGEGLAAAAVTPEIARFALNLTATNIIFVAESYKHMKARN